MIEQWRTVLAAPAYEVSDQGRVRRALPGRRTAAGRVLKPIALRNGYLAVRPVVDGRNVQMYVHRIVAETFVPREAGREHVNHKNGDKQDARAANLEWVTHAENMAHAARTGLMVCGERHGGAKLSNAQVAEMRELHAAGQGVCALARSYGVSPSTVSEIVNNRRRTP